MKELFLLFAIVFVLSCVPAAVAFLRARRRFSGTLIVTCPETQKAATIRLQAGHAAFSSLTGEPDLKVESCNRWAGKAGQCDERCLVEDEALILAHAKSA